MNLTQNLPIGIQNFEKEYAEVCGIAETELKYNFSIEDSNI